MSRIVKIVLRELLKTHFLRCIFVDLYFYNLENHPLEPLKACFLNYQNPKSPKRIIKKLFIELPLILCLSVSSVMAQNDTVIKIGNRIDFEDVVIKKRRVGRLYRNKSRLERAVYKVYPVALEAGRLLKETEDTILIIKDKREQKRYLRRLEKQLYTKYKPILRDMTFSEGLILLKLIDRETGNTSYNLVKEFREGFRHSFGRE